MTHIFISYSHKDSPYAQRLADALKKESLPVWIDERIDYGTKWPIVIQQHLDDCAAFVVVMSPRSFESEWVHNELSRAKEKRKPIFPLLLDGDVWLSVQATQYIDVRGGKLPPAKFYEQLKPLFPQPSETPPAPSPAATPQAAAPAAQAVPPHVKRGVVFLIIAAVELFIMVIGDLGSATGLFGLILFAILVVSAMGAFLNLSNAFNKPDKQ